MSNQQERPQLQMVWLPNAPIAHIEPQTAAGYRIRTYQEGDESAFLSLMADGEFGPWDEEKLHFNMARILPDGWFFAVEERSLQIVGTAMCLHNYTGHTPFTGDVGWVVCTPSHRGHGLGYALSAQVTNRFLDAGYKLIQLHTEHYRLPAIKTYLKLGYSPLLGPPAVNELWQDVCETLGWPFTPDSWPRGE